MRTDTHITSQPWIYSALSDGAFILAPAFLVSFAVILFPDLFVHAELSPLLWLILIVGVDVSHVYSTLYRTYFDKEEFQKYRKPLTLIPILGFIGGVILYQFGYQVFWGFLAYIALYHFVRQQYGFFRIYSRKETGIFPFEKSLEQLTIYLSTLYPVVYWHCHPRVFNWFIEDDFLFLPFPWISAMVGWIYLLALVLYFGKELYRSWENKQVNLPKNLILLGTALSWYLGIVIYNSDLIFSATNVIAHGIPYMALIWMYGKKKSHKKGGTFLFRLPALPIFFALIFFFAFVEEGLWDSWVWGDHPQFFHIFSFLPKPSQAALQFIVPLLVLPQLTHYMIDGFIWRVKGKDTTLKAVLTQ